MDVLGKYDMTAEKDQGLIASINLPEGCSGGEFIMVPRAAPSGAAAAEEDDGWLLGHVTDENTMNSYVLVCFRPMLCHSQYCRLVISYHVRIMCLSMPHNSHVLACGSNSCT